MREDYITKTIGVLGLVVLIVTVALDGDIQRILWAVSAVFLFFYCILREDYINSAVNFWIFVVNLYYLI